MVNPLNPIHMSRLRRSREKAWKDLSTYREKRTATVKQFVGQHYSDNGSASPVPVNEISLMVNVLLRLLAPRNPKTWIRPKIGYKQLAPVAWDFEIALNATLSRIEFSKSLRLCILDALFSNGFMKVALHEDSRAEINDMRYQGYHPFADVVDLDDFVIDLSAKRWERASFMGDKYFLDYDTVMNSPLFDQQAKDGLVPSDRSDNEGGDERVAEIGAEAGPDDESLKDKLEVWDLYLPQEQLVVTMTADDDRPPLRIFEWNGPELGPYMQLGFIDVPNNIMKASPSNLLMDLHVLANEMYNKARDQGMDQKTVLGYMAEAAEDAESIINATDRDAIKLNHPDKIREFNFNGVDQTTLAFALEVMSRFSYFSGNLDSYGGLGVQADTAKQEEMISGSAGAQIQDMQAVVSEFVKDACSRLGNLLWNDPIIQMPLSRSPKGVEHLGVEQSFLWTPEHRIGEFLRYNIEINPYSMRDKTPQQQLNTVMTFIGQVYGANAQIAMAQGAMLNFEKVARLWARLADMDEIEDLIDFNGPPTGDRRGPVGEPLQKPAVTKRTYERINRPGIKAPGQQQIMQQMLLGSKLQPAQRAAVGRPNG